jgi:plasmid stabilization system protein ParE
MPDAYQVRITPRASSDLEEIFDYIRQFSPQNAGTMIERLMDAIDGLEMFPSRFRSSGRSRKRGNPVHSCVVRPYTVYYRLDEQNRVVVILTVRHGARRQPRRFE